MSYEYFAQQKSDHHDVSWYLTCQKIDHQQSNMSYKYFTRQNFDHQHVSQYLPQQKINHQHVLRILHSTEDWPPTCLTNTSLDRRLTTKMSYEYFAQQKTDHQHILRILHSTEDWPPTCPTNTLLDKWLTTNTFHDTYHDRRLTTNTWLLTRNTTLDHRHVCNIYLDDSESWPSTRLITSVKDFKNARGSKRLSASLSCRARRTAKHCNTAPLIASWLKCVILVTSLTASCKLTWWRVKRLRELWLACTTLSCSSCHTGIAWVITATGELARERRVKRLSCVAG